MYAIVDAGGKQARVEVGERLEVERLASSPGDEVRLRALLVVDGDDVVTDRATLSDFEVAANVIGESKGVKITGFTYKPKTRRRRRFGHRQHYTTVEITRIEPPKAKKAVRAEKAPRAEKAAKAEATPAPGASTDEGEGAKKAAPRRARAAAKVKPTADGAGGQETTES
jgi:large subunit ribosomal protein L21